MAHPHHSPQRSQPPEGETRQAGEAFESLSADLAAEVERDVERYRPEPDRRPPLPTAQRPATPPPAASAGRGAGPSVGPLHPARFQPQPQKPPFNDVNRVVTAPQSSDAKPDFTIPHRAYLANPLDQLVEVVEEAHRLRQEVEVLVSALTGEVPVAIGRLHPVGPTCGLLPNVSRLASEIGSIHGQISERIGQAMGRLG